MAVEEVEVVVALGTAPDLAMISDLVMVKEVDQGPVVEGMEGVAVVAVVVEEKGEGAVQATGQGVDMAPDTGLEEHMVEGMDAAEVAAAAAQAQDRAPGLAMVQTTGLDMGVGVGGTHNA